MTDRKAWVIFLSSGASAEGFLSIRQRETTDASKIPPKIYPKHPHCPTPFPIHPQGHVECILSSVHQRWVQWPRCAMGLCKLKKTTLVSGGVRVTWWLKCDKYSGCHYSKSGLMMSSLVSFPLPLSFTESSFSRGSSFLSRSLSNPTPQFHGVPDPGDPSDTAICYSEKCTRVSTVHSLTPRRRPHTSAVLDHSLLNTRWVPGTQLAAQVFRENRCEGCGPDTQTPQQRWVFKDGIGKCLTTITMSWEGTQRDKKKKKNSETDLLCKTWKATKRK